LPFLRTLDTVAVIMSHGEQSASQAGPEILDDCRAARIEEVTHFAQCLVKTRPSCRHRLTFSTFRYCIHPQREAIIARTLASGV
jgi:hypothetical protein